MAILDLHQHSQAKDALQYIELRHRDVLRLEQSIIELHQLFLDVAMMIENQGEMVDQIEYNVGQSVAYTKEAVSELKKAETHAKKSRKVYIYNIQIDVDWMNNIAIGYHSFFAYLLNPSSSSSSAFPICLSLL